MTKVVIYYSCPCSIGKHKIDTSTVLGKYLHKCITTLGETVRISTNGKTFHDVSRIYIAFHGLKGSEVKTFPLSIDQDSN